MTALAEKLKRLEAQGRYRSLQDACGADLTSNDYLGLGNHPVLTSTAIKALEGGLPAGSGGSRLLRGNHPAHTELEDFAAAFFGCERALFFATGFQANTALFTTLPGRHDTILFDALIHASARDGIQASSARHIRIPHNDLNAFEDALKKVGGGTAWIAVETVYSMDGDIAPVRDLLNLAERYNAFLILDEAHATGVFGKTGRGVAEGYTHDRLITLHTCGKALGVAGGLVCAQAEIIDYLVNSARPFIYSTAPMPLQAVLVQKALQLSDEEPWRRKKLLALRDYTNGLLPVPDSPSQIIPIVLGDDRRAVETAASLQEVGFDIRAIRPPTVPDGTARLRLSLNVGVTENDLERFAEYLVPYLQTENVA